MLIQTGLDSHPHMELKHLTELPMSDPLSRLRLIILSSGQTLSGPAEDEDLSEIITGPSYFAGRSVTLLIIHVILSRVSHV